MSGAIESKSVTRKFSLGRAFMWLILAFVIFATIFPFWWVVRTGLTSPNSVFQDTTNLLPVDPTTQNYERTLGMLDTQDAVAAGGSGQSIDFIGSLKNSIIFSTLITIFQVAFSTMAAYAFARLRFPGRNFLFGLYISALMVPAIVTLIPNVILVRNLNWLDPSRQLLPFIPCGIPYIPCTKGWYVYMAMVAPYFFMTPFAVFFLRQFFLGINPDIEHAARIDGAGYWSVFSKIVLPVSRAPIATLAIITFIASWNEYLWPSIVGRGVDHRVLTVALAFFRSSQPYGRPDWPGMMAATSLAIVPVLILYMIFGRRVLDSIQFTGFK